MEARLPGRSRWKGRVCTRQDSFLCGSCVVGGGSWDKVGQGNAPEDGGRGRGRGRGEGEAERQAGREVKKEESCCHKAKASVP